MSDPIFGEIISKWFVKDLLKRPLDQSKIFTLEEFFEANRTLIGSNDLLVCNKNNEKILGQGCTSYKLLMLLLLKLGFTHTDWIMLLPRDVVQFQKYVKTLSKEEQKKLPYVKVCGMKQNSLVTWAIDLYLKKKFEDKCLDGIITLEHFLSLNHDDMLALSLEKNHPAEMVHSIRASFKIAKAKLTELGFGKEEPFMTLYQPGMKMTRTTVINQALNHQLSLFPISKTPDGSVASEDRAATG